MSLENTLMRMNWMTIVAIIVIVVALGYLILKRRSRA
jgi:LPXTG-motif cell wall-anchored protein